jgi:hypothetical protein
MNRMHRYILSLLLSITGSVLQLDAQEYECTATDGWLPVGSGQQGHTAFAAAADDKLIYLYSWGGPSGYGILSAWDGIGVRTLSTNTRRVEYPQMVVYRGMPYLGGGNLEDRALKRWNGRAWESSGLTNGPYAGEFISSMIVYKDRLYAGSNVRGLMIGDGAEDPYYLAFYNGKKWEAISLWCDPSSWRPYITAMGVYNGDLIVSGNFISIEGVSARHFARFDGTNWRAIPALDGMTPASEIIQFRDKLVYGIYQSSIVEWDGKSTVRTIADRSSNVPLLPDWPVTRSMAVFNERLYSFGTVDVPGASGPIRRTAAAFDGTTWHPVSSVRQWAWPIVYRGKLYAHGLIESSCGTPLNNLAYYCDENSCIRITGSVYRDSDANCEQDYAEPGIPRRIVEVNPGPIYATTDARGEYVQFVEPGTYSVATVPYLHWTKECSNDRPAPMTITAGVGKESQQDLAVAPIPGIHDLRVSVAGNAIRAGRATDYILHYVNVGTEPSSGTLRFNFDNSVPTFT